MHVIDEKTIVLTVPVSMFTWDKLFDFREKLWVVRGD